MSSEPANAWARRELAYNLCQQRRYEEALEEVVRMLHVYGDVAENVMAMPVIRGVKSRAP